MKFKRMVERCGRCGWFRCLHWMRRHDWCDPLWRGLVGLWVPKFGYWDRRLTPGEISDLSGMDNHVLIRGGEWTHRIETYDGTDKRTYLNGVEVLE